MSATPSVRWVLLIVLALVAVACGDDDAETTDDGSGHATAAADNHGRRHVRLGPWDTSSRPRRDRDPRCRRSPAKWLPQQDQVYGVQLAIADYGGGLVTP
jgi:hypothetical protein